MRRPSNLLFCALSCLSLAGCGAITAEQACDEYVKALCERLSACAPPSVDLPFGDVATCQARTKLTCPERLVLPGTSLSPQRLADCAKAAQGLSCDDLIGGVPPAACATLPGTVADGAACTADPQCKSTYCKPMAGGCGTCAPRAKAGETCAGGECESGLTCYGQMGMRKCTAPATDGQPCTAAPCRGGLLCKAGVCAKQFGAGVACAPLMSECASAQGLYCNLTSKTCEAQKTANAGEACGFVMGAAVACRAGTSCKLTPPMFSGTCVASAKDGEACNPAMSVGCLAPATCTDGVCKLPQVMMCVTP